MSASKSVRAAIVVALLTAVSAPSAGDEPGMSAPITIAAPAPSITVSTATSLRGDGWSYSTYYIYPLTRHMDESKIPQVWRYVLYPLTATIDTGQLPFGALAGLFGD